ncbi:PREDICTED: protein HGH1 homolog [Ceratosolen solmsi marchali]|uniref:Protein HGH1 homolog n=1 Tax=Ceratosolen solmsi marchali TaxID=326594 RepID=A0AAJ6YRV2_9HYME|nr:PREDICTED: protein HGH1 homolog [Ceratosolen solmsi marchali]
MDLVQELIDSLDSKCGLDIKEFALDSILGMTGTQEGRQYLVENPKILRKLILLLQDNTPRIALNASSALINISADEDGSSALLIISESSKCIPKDNEIDNLIYLCFSNILNQRSSLADSSCEILSNMTRSNALVDRILALAERNGFTWDSLLIAFTTTNYNWAKNKLPYLGPIFCNITQSQKIRNYLLEKDQWVLRRFLLSVEHRESVLTRRSIIGTLRNCCFDIQHHDVLLGADIDILRYLLLPLAGPNELTAEENDGLPVYLRYLPESKRREENTENRIMILEALGQLCATKKGREYLRENNAYIILRELHKWEKNKAALLACENVVDILIKTEEEIGVDNLKDIEVPEVYKEKFNELDKLYLEDRITEPESIGHH